MLKINPEKETRKIVNFIQTTFKAQGFEKAVIAVSGGVDSAVCLHLLSQTLDKKNITPLHLPYAKQNTGLSTLVIKSTGISSSKIVKFNIKPIVDAAVKASQCKKLAKSKVRLGNLMARARMMLIYDLAKKRKALVCGTENHSEHLLGYFTRFGDEASDFEPIKHLYKTQVYQLAKYLKIPREIIQAPPSAGLWPGQTDEKQFGFSYKEADQVLYLYTQKKLSLEKIKKKGYSQAEKIVKFMKQNTFKQTTPYSLT